MTQLQLTFGRAPRPRKVSVHQRRATKRDAIEQLFTVNAGTRFSSAEMHSRFGTAFRSRVSEINRKAAAAVVIRNEVTHDDTDGSERSVYWAEPKRCTGS